MTEKIKIGEEPQMSVSKDVLEDVDKLTNLIGQIRAEFTGEKITMQTIKKIDDAGSIIRDLKKMFAWTKEDWSDDDKLEKDSSKDKS